MVLRCCEEWYVFSMTKMYNGDSRFKSTRVSGQDSINKIVIIVILSLFFSLSHTRTFEMNPVKVISVGKNEKCKVKKMTTKNVRRSR